MTAPDDLWRHQEEPPALTLDDGCACCGWVAWWRNPDCVQSQPPEFVIDNARPGVLRAPRPDDFGPVGRA